ncbi:hypothetical protein MTR67_026441 [Solanum verrucosum]|uniref:Uncharacterized protein n=1 Tax=Solanum verrucosum TaxID=315347 RepID=A0AAF0R770_SOLVR|nr:hypothetical protein MTR67_026441 [Solanum verrucosum]
MTNINLSQECNGSNSDTVSESMPSWCHAAFDLEGIVRRSHSTCALQGAGRQSLVRRMAAAPCKAHGISRLAACISRSQWVAYFRGARVSKVLTAFLKGQFFDLCVHKEPFVREGWVRDRESLDFCGAYFCESKVALRHQRRVYV